MGYYYLLTKVLVVFLTLTKCLGDVSSLQDQNQDHLDPLQDQDQDLGTNNQDKRTICSALNKCGGPTSGYVRRLVIRGGSKPQIVGYAPLVRPIILGGYRYPKPKFQYRLKLPSAVHDGWKPVQTAIKPVVETVKPANHVDIIHNNPVPHVDHVAPPAQVRPDHLHLQQTFVHLKPVAAAPPHVDQVHQVNVPHGDHYDTFTHIDHLQPAPVAQPVVPVAPPPAIIKPIAPSPVLFEVTRPNLGVLPLGARFNTHVLREVPHLHLSHVGSAIAPHVHPVSHVQGIIHSPVGLPAHVPQPGVSVEYHGTRNYLPLAGAVPFFHQSHGFNLGALHSHQHLPYEHSAHAFAAQQQALPHEHSTQFLAPEQQLHHHSSSPHFQQQLQAIQQYQEVPQGQLPLEGEPQQSLDQYFQSNQQTFQNFDQGNVIQPGQTDVQIPYHLPEHGGWQVVQQQQQQQEESRRFEDQVFRPSQQLEAPYKK